MSTIARRRDDRLDVLTGAALVMGAGILLATTASAAWLAWNAFARLTGVGD